LNFNVQKQTFTAFQGLNRGYAAIHACEHDTVTFLVSGAPHNLKEILATGARIVP
jgi:hypothetical protein